ncbi:hypothetical protein J2W57_000191 [Chryseobacterium ginsenosidimutans]|jgi:hypothetical protein|uniref:Cyclic nucleotide-binding domain-containing protein n=1 Tax=Chryseobacterium geocarposphaerae TaxID=1416776 RepID=A0ABU1L990_9FLAO|nr:hypothetical protein [Chryseobacterium geocarposphaerae]MDR6696842.1 hypothetical protein [Chryseobacterium ginsenosidimutans]
MLISEAPPIFYEAVIKNYKPSEFIFREGDTANYYYQIVTLI